MNEVPPVEIHLVIPADKAASFLDEYETTGNKELPLTVRAVLNDIYAILRDFI